MLGGRIRNRSAVWLLLLALASASAFLPVRGNVNDLTLFGSASKGWGFTSTSVTSPGPTIFVTQNTVINVTLTSADGLQHKFFIDYNGNGIPDANEPTSELFTNTTSLLVKASVAGTFKYFCAFHPSIMYGTLTVKGGSSQAPTTVNFGLFPLLLIGGAVAIGATLFMVLGSAKSTHFRRQKKRV